MMATPSEASHHPRARARAAAPMLTVSDVMPCRDAEAFIARAIRSVMAQTRAPVRVLELPHDWLRIARRHPFVASHRITINYRIHAGQMSARRDWNEKVELAWRERNRGAVRFLLGLHRYTPRRAPLARAEWQARLMLRSAWDALPGGARRVLRRSALRSQAR